LSFSSPPTDATIFIRKRLVQTNARHPKPDSESQATRCKTATQSHHPKISNTVFVIALIQNLRIRPRSWVGGVLNSANIVPDSRTVVLDLRANLHHVNIPYTQPNVARFWESGC
jgi:hypothetical protein